MRKPTTKLLQGTLGFPSRLSQVSNEVTNTSIARAIAGVYTTELSIPNTAVTAVFEEP
jgi:hypothetical protein